MPDWYVSSAAYGAVSAFVASHAYIVGNLLKPTAPAVGREYVYRCTTAGTSSTEPTWSGAYVDGATITSGGATFTNVSGQSAYGWSAAAGTLYSISASAVNRTSAGDRIFCSSDHSDSLSGSLLYAFNNNVSSFSLIQILSVNRAGSVPPVAADLTSGASLTVTANLTLESYTPTFWQGFTFSSGSTAPLFLSNGGSKAHYFKYCSLVLTGNNARINTNGSNQTPVKVIFDSTTVSFNNINQSICAAGGMIDLLWINTVSAILGSTLPTSLFTGTGVNEMLATLRGVDLSALTSGNIFTASQNQSSGSKILLDSCKIASGVTRYAPPATASGATNVDDVELVNCWDGTNVINERHNIAGDITTDRSTYLTSGAQDDIGNYSLKLASNARSEKWAVPLECFVFDVENTLTGSSRTATVEIVSSGTLNSDDISLSLEYMGTSGNPTASFVNTLPATILTAGSALSSSSNAWTSPPATPQKQLLQATFTPQRAGRVRALVRLGKPSTTVWVDPRITIT